jgi:hypothetical protein
MSRAPKRIKLEPDPRSNENRKEDKNSRSSGRFMPSSVDHDKEPLYSGQFMTSSIDNNKEVRKFS